MNQAQAVCGGPLRVLLTEDHLDTARLMERILRMSGFDVIVATSHAEATAAAAAARIDVLLADIRLHDSTGWDLLEVVRRSSPDAVGIAVTGLGYPADKDRSMAAGYCVHLTKPIHVDQLLTAIQECSQATRVTEEVTDRASFPTC